MASKIELLKILKESLIEFIEQLISILPSEKSLCAFRLYVEHVSIPDVANYIIKNLIPIEDKVKAREENYFLENAVLFERLQNYNTQVNHFRYLWESTDDPENKEGIWKWLKHFIDLGKKIQMTTL